MTKPKATLLKTDRLLLRAFQESDIENVFKGLSDPIVTKYYGISFDSLTATKEQMTICYWRPFYFCVFRCIVF